MKPEDYLKESLKMLDDALANIMDINEKPICDFAKLLHALAQFGETTYYNIVNGR